MKHIVCTIDGGGRLTLGKDMLASLNVEVGDVVGLAIEGDCIKISSNENGWELAVKPKYRIQLPKAVRDRLGLSLGSQVIIKREDGCLKASEYDDSKRCSACSDIVLVIEAIKGLRLCKECMAKLSLRVIHELPRAASNKSILAEEEELKGYHACGFYDDSKARLRMAERVLQKSIREHNQVMVCVSRADVSYLKASEAVKGAKDGQITYLECHDYSSWWGESVETMKSGLDRLIGRAHEQGYQGVAFIADAEYLISNGDGGLDDLLVVEDRCSVAMEGKAVKCVCLYQSAGIQSVKKELIERHNLIIEDVPDSIEYKKAPRLEFRMIPRIA